MTTLIIEANERGKVNFFEQIHFLFGDSQFLHTDLKIDFYIVGDWALTVAFSVLCNFDTAALFTSRSV